MKQSNNNYRKKNRDFGLLTGTVLILLAGFLFLKKGEISFYIVIPGLLLVFAGILIPRWLAPLRRAWEAIGAVLGKLNTYLILTIIYFILFVPLAWLLRLMGKDLLDRKIHPELKSYWVNKQSTSEDSIKYQF